MLLCLSNIGDIMASSFRLVHFAKLFNWISEFMGVFPRWVRLNDISVVCAAQNFDFIHSLWNQGSSTGAYAVLYAHESQSVVYDVPIYNDNCIKHKWCVYRIVRVRGGQYVCRNIRMILPLMFHMGRECHTLTRTLIYGKCGANGKWFHQKQLGKLLESWNWAWKWNETLLLCVFGACV